MTNMPDWGGLPTGYHHHPSALSDVQEVAVLFNGCSQAIIGVEDTTIEDLRAEWSTPEFNLAASTKLVLAAIS